MGQTVSIYCLKDPDSGMVYYVGQTIRTLSIRLSQHISVASKGENTSKSIWIRDAIQAGKTPVIELIEECPPDQGKAKEEQWIQRYLSLNAGLLNQQLRGKKAFWLRLEQKHIDRLEELAMLTSLTQDEVVQYLIEHTNIKPPELFFLAR